MTARLSRVGLSLIFSAIAAARLPAHAADDVYSTAAVSNHLERLRSRAGEGFTVLWQHPFAVAGDMPPATVRRIATNTIAWATTRLKRDFFSADPKEIVEVWLFQNDASYRRNARRLFDDSPSTPFGYYSAQHRALVMNISTGTGTLVHEMTHAFMAANFPKCPSWFNEGFASLYEQSGDRNGHIAGFPNWRLPKLQEAIRSGRVPSFEKLTSLSSDEFYGRTTGAAYNEQYAQARYLCYYLQEHGLLSRFYRDFTTNVVADPTGFKTLKKTLGEPDMQVFQKKWEVFVLMLAAP